ncbi:TPA: DMT family transporter [Citrobacter farmeri]|uniref:EamA family transporter n=2 Tax=Citrobacter farmeri TaxID=67824 RepID=A0ACA8DA64_9ENTR|nr:DMT family transporter [Citrobacter farmeri]HAT2169070.1 DMT family transporter [Citrobacter freundii]AST81245.1 EamA family transporter [Citrobacter farmeri]EMB4691788.1 DMT family transporter [Citrobacter farmeri]MCP1692079.1 drug/metabolite transporter (DMT)-like permease [Citrobacter farmeri]MCW2421654.1 drug/metabolite transporter (DMT)-like permease [Citrobacter farmeri]
MNREVLLSQFYAFLTVAIWSSAYVYTKVALLTFSATALGLLRCGVATLCLMTLLTFYRQLAVKWRHIPVFMLSGASGFSLYFIAFNTGSLSLNPTTASIIIALCPIISALLALVVFKEKLRTSQWLATLTAFSAVLFISLQEGSLLISQGIIWMLGAAALLALYNVIQRRMNRQISALQMTAYSFLFGTVMLLGYAPDALRELHDAPSGAIALVIYLGLFPGAVAYITWGKALSLAENTGQVTNWMFLTPCLALLLEYVVTDSYPGKATLAGGTIILICLLCFLRKNKSHGR